MTTILGRPLDEPGTEEVTHVLTAEACAVGMTGGSLTTGRRCIRAYRVACCSSLMASFTDM